MHYLFGWGFARLVFYIAAPYGIVHGVKFVPIQFHEFLHRCIVAVSVFSRKRHVVDVRVQ